MSLPGRHKPIHKRIEIVRSFKMTRLMLEQIIAACDENNICFSHFLREAINKSLSRYNQQKQLLEQRERRPLTELPDVVRCEDNQNDDHSNQHSYLRPGVSQ